LPLHVPVSTTAIADLSAEKVWAYAIRLLTSLANPNDIVKFVGKGTGTEIPANTSIVDLLNTLTSRLNASRATYLDYLSTVLNAKLPLMELEQAYVADEVQATLNTTGAFLTLGSRNITVALPSGASRVRAIALAMIHIANRTPTVQNIDLLLNVAGSTVFNQNNVLSFAAAEGAGIATIVQDCTVQVTGDGTFSIEAQARISAAANVTFTVEYLIFVQYRMS